MLAATTRAEGSEEQIRSIKCHALVQVPVLKDEGCEADRLWAMLRVSKDWMDVSVPCKKLLVKLLQLVREQQGEPGHAILYASSYPAE
jgi:hypothetical protein